MTFFFTLVFVVLVFWRPQEWLLPWLYGWNTLDIVVYAALLSLLVEVREGRVRFPRELPQVVLLPGLLFAAVMSHAAHFYWAGVVGTIPDTLKICLFTLLLLCALNTPSRLRWMAVVFVAMACVMAVHAILQETRGYGFAGSSPLYMRATETRPEHTRSLFFGIFEDPNDLAQILATAIPFAFAIPRRRSFRGRAFGAGISILLILAILTTRSRGGYVALAAVGGVMLALWFPERWLPALMAALLVLALVLCPFSSAYLDEAAHDRIDFWGQANWVFKKNLLFGVGYGMFNDYISGGRAAHNAFVLCYTELGLFGYWFWFVLLQLGVVGAWRTRMALRNPENDEQAYLKRFSGLSIAAMTGFCVSSYFLTRAFVYPLFFLLAVLGALPAVARQYLPEDTPPLVDMRRDALIYGSSGTVVSILYIYFSIILLNKAFYG